MTDEAGGLDAGADTGGGVQPTDAGPADTSFAFPQDFESVGDEPLESAEPITETPEGTPPGTRPAEVQQEAKPPVQAGQKPPQASTATTKPVAPPVAQPVQPQAPKGREASSAPQRPGTQQLLERLSANRDSILGELAGSRFKVELTKAETEALEVDAVAALPQILSRMAANVYYEAAMASLNQIQNLVPHMTQSLMAQNVDHVNAEQTFWGAWPQLNRADEQTARTVQEFANFYRQRNPNASQADAIQAVGKAVSAFLGVPIQAPSGQQQRGAPAAPRGGARPFTPAGGGKVAQRLPSGANGALDPFHGMGMDFD